MDDDRWSIVKTKKENHKDMASSHWVATLLQTWIVFFPIYPDKERELVLVQLSLNFLWTAEKFSRWMKICLLMLLEVCLQKMNGVIHFLRIVLSLRKGIRPAASNRTQNGLVVALLPCAVGISCWSGTPGDPKGATPGCWKISPWRPTSIRDLLAWSGI